MGDVVPHLRLAFTLLTEHEIRRLDFLIYLEETRRRHFLLERGVVRNCLLKLYCWLLVFHQFRCGQLLVNFGLGLKAEMREKDLKLIGLFPEVVG